MSTASKPKPEIIDPGLIAAMRHYANRMASVRATMGTALEAFYVHTYEDGSRKSFHLEAVLGRVADLLETNDIDFLKMRHLRKVLGDDMIDRVLRYPT